MRKIIMISSFLINPMVAIFYIIKNIKRKEIFILGISLLIAYYGFNISLLPEMDIYRHYEFFNNEIKINDFNFSSSKYFGLYILCFVIK
ncbi:MAG: hypothetical protein ACTJGM_03795 [Fusobacterium sp.]